MIVVEDLDRLDVAVNRAKTALLDLGDRPIGAVLAIGDNLLFIDHSQAKSKKNCWAHAENQLLVNHSHLIWQAQQDKKPVVLYSTMECCLMCAGAAVHHRVSRIVYLCPDALGGALHINQEALDVFSRQRWPEIEGGLELLCLPHLDEIQQARARTLFKDSVWLYEQWIQRWDESPEKDLLQNQFALLREKIESSSSNPV